MTTAVDARVARRCAATVMCDNPSTVTAEEVAQPPSETQFR